MNTSKRSRPDEIKIEVSRCDDDSGYLAVVYGCHNCHGYKVHGWFNTGITATNNTPEEAFAAAHEGVKEEGWEF
jgi:hypothetical protein